MQIFLTKNNLLAQKGDQAGFFTLSGEFIPECSQSEFYYLSETQEIPEIRFENKSGALLSWDMVQVLENINEYKWKFLFSTQDSDYTNWKSGSSCNGGDYANFTRYSWFARHNNGKVQFCCLTEHYSSAEFHQTWDGKYQNPNDCNWTNLIDTEEQFQLSEWQQEESEASLLQFGSLVELNELFEANYSIPQRDDVDQTIQEIPVGFSEYLRRWRIIRAALGISPWEVAQRKKSKRFTTSKGRRR